MVRYWTTTVYPKDVNNPKQNLLHLATYKRYTLRQFIDNKYFYFLISSTAKVNLQQNLLKTIIGVHRIGSLIEAYYDKSKEIVQTR